MHHISKKEFQQLIENGQRRSKSILPKPVKKKSIKNPRKVES